MANVDITEGLSEEYERTLLAKLQNMHENLAPYWTSSRMEKKSVDTLFSSLLPYFSKLRAFEDKIVSMEDSQRKKLLVIVDQESKKVKKFLREHQGLQGKVDLMTLETARQAFRSINDRVSQNILNADLGLVKIEWSRFIGKENRENLLKEQKKEKEDQYTEQFQRIREKLPEPIVKTSEE